MKYVGILPGKVTLKATEAKEINILFLRRERAEDKAEDSQLMSDHCVGRIRQKGLHHTLLTSSCAGSRHTKDIATL